MNRCPGPWQAAEPWCRAELRFGNDPAGRRAAAIDAGSDPLYRVLHFTQRDGTVLRERARQAAIVPLVGQVLGMEAGWFHGIGQLAFAVARSAGQVVAQREQGPIMPGPLRIDAQVRGSGRDAA